jgi:hypothetical protein
MSHVTQIDSVVFVTLVRGFMYLLSCVCGVACGGFGFCSSLLVFGKKKKHLGCDCIGSPDGFLPEYYHGRYMKNVYCEKACWVWGQAAVSTIDRCSIPVRVGEGWRASGIDMCQTGTQLCGSELMSSTYLFKKREKKNLRTYKGVGELLHHQNVFFWPLAALGGTESTKASMWGGVGSTAPSRVHQ